MEKKARAVLAVTALLLTGMLAWAAANEPPEAVEVRGVTVQAQNIYNSVSVSGTVEAAESVSLCPAADAVVAGTLVSVGDTVRQGERLCVLMPSLSSFPAADELQGVWEALAQTNGRTGVSESGSALTSPVSGTVLSLPEAGRRVYANLPCACVADLERLQVRAQVPELYAAEVREGQRANITASAAGEAVYAASVQSVAPVAVRAASLTGESGPASVEALLPLRGQTEGLRPGYSASAKIFTDYRPAAAVVPYDAVFQRDRQEYVFIAENGRARLRAVTTGYLLENVAEIAEGLSAGDVVLRSPPDTLSDGEPVKVAV